MNRLGEFYTKFSILAVTTLHKVAEMSKNLKFEQI